MTKEESYKCEKCDREFDSERGLHIHQGQKHDNNESENNEEDNVEEENNREVEKNTKEKALEDRRKLNIDIRLIASTTFILGFILGSLVTIGLYEVDFERNNWEEQIDLEDRPVLGDEDAPVTIVSYEDYFCPFCGAFNNENVAQEIGGNSAFPQIKEEYIEEGKVNFYFKHFPTQGGSNPAIASECVADQDHDEFWEFHELHYERTMELTELVREDQDEYEAELFEIVENLDVDFEEFETCYENEETLDQVQQDYNEGQEFGIEGTPGVVVEGELVAGAQPFNVFEEIIEANL